MSTPPVDPPPKNVKEHPMPTQAPPTIPQISNVPLISSIEKILVI